LIGTMAARMHREERVRIHLLAVEPAPTGHAMQFLRHTDVRRLLRGDGPRRLGSLLLRHDAWRIRTRLVKLGFACELL
jgi:hypothetical protein